MAGIASAINQEAKKNSFQIKHAKKGQTIMVTKAQYAKLKERFGDYIKEFKDGAVKVEVPGYLASWFDKDISVDCYIETCRFYQTSSERGGWTGD